MAATATGGVLLLVEDDEAIGRLVKAYLEQQDGWRVLWNDGVTCPVCGDLCKRRALPAARPLVYVGDGYSDRCAALAADRVFARDGLAAYLTSRDVPFEPFETLDDVAAALS